MNLFDYQSRFARYAFGRDEPEGLPEIEFQGIRIAEGFQAYRRSVRLNLATTIERIYPLIATIIGHRLMRVVALDYQDHYPSLSGDLNDYGDQFYRFLKTHESVVSLPYLPDVAQLEWAIHEVYREANSLMMNPDEMTKIPPEQWGFLRFKLATHFRIQESLYPLFRIWEVNQTHFEGDQSVNFSCAQTVLVIRRNFKVEVRPLENGERQVLKSLAQGLCLEEAIDALPLNSVEDFDLSSFLNQLLTSGLVCGVENLCKDKS